MKNALLWIAKKILFIGTQSVSEIVTAYCPPLGLLLQSVVSSVVVTEGSSPKAPGVTKKELALLAVQAAIPGIQAAFTAANKPIVNPSLFADGIEKIQEGVVDILNATGDLAKV